jgi:hypothetical protein
VAPDLNFHVGSVNAVESIHLPTYQGAMLHRIARIGGARISRHVNLLDPKTKLRAHRPATTTPDGLAEI